MWCSEWNMKLDASAKVISCKDETDVNSTPKTPLLFVFPLPGRSKKGWNREDTCDQARQKIVEDKNKRRGERLPAR